MSQLLTTEYTPGTKYSNAIELVFPGSYMPVI